MLRNVMLPFAASVVVLFASSVGLADKFNKVLEVGDKAPAFSNVPGVDDAEHGLAEYDEAKAVVMVFTCNHCPVAVRYEDRLIALQKDYKDKDIQVVAINVNNVEADRLDMMKRRAADKGFNFPYLYDSSQAAGREYGAQVTPHVFLLDQDRKIAYMGAIDDNWGNADEVSRHYLREAIDAVLDGKSPEVASTKPTGCGIQYE